MVFTKLFIRSADGALREIDVGRFLFDRWHQGMSITFDDGEFPEAVLDESVFEGMEADDGDDTFWF